jgi:glycolate oxidase subunit GlcD
MPVPENATTAITEIVGGQWCKSDPVELDTFATDGLPMHDSRPGLVVIPGSREEVVAVLQVLGRFQIPFVARGAGTGLSGGAVAAEDSVLLVLTRLNRVLEIDQANRRAIVEPGVVNVQLSALTEPLGLHYAPDPSSQTVCSIGGNVAENAGGPHCLKYGVTSNHILEIEVALPNGDLITLGSPGGEPWGPDLVGLFVGSEGMFGIATRITVRLTPSPKAVATLLAGFDSLRTAGEAVTRIIASGIVPAALEMMDQNSVAIVEASIYKAGYPTDAAAVLIVEIDGLDRHSVRTDADQVNEILTASGAQSIKTADDPAQRARLWQGRKKTFGALGRIAPDLLVQDAVVPRSTLPDILERIGQIAIEHGLPVSNVFHAGDGNLHPNISFDRRETDMLERVERAATAIMRACIDAGGTITGEHGVGIDKLHLMPLVFDPDTMGVMRRIRLAFDPEERANPGKVLPIHSCRYREHQHGATGAERTSETTGIAGSR